MNKMSFNDYMKYWYKVDLGLEQPFENGKIGTETSNKLFTYFSTIELEGTPIEYAIDSLVIDYLEEC